MKDLFVIGEHEAIETNCPQCGQPVRTYWRKETGGMLSRPSVVLVADSVYHAACYDVFVKPVD